MDVNLLGNEELKYELTVRGLPITGTFAQRRAELRNALRMEREGSIQPPSSSPFESVSELCLCGAKLYSVERDILNFDDDNRESNFRKISTLLEHIRSRICRIHPDTNADQILRNNLWERFNNLSQRLHSTYMENAQPVSNDEPIISNDLISFDDGQALTETNQETSDPPIAEIRSDRRLISAPVISRESWDYSNSLDSRSRDLPNPDNPFNLSRHILETQNNNFPSHSLHVSHNSQSQAPLRPPNISQDSFRRSLPPTHSSHSESVPQTDNRHHSLIDASLPDLQRHLIPQTTSRIYRSDVPRSGSDIFQTSIPTFTQSHVSSGGDSRQSWIPSNIAQSSLSQGSYNTYTVPDQGPGDGIRQPRSRELPPAESSDSRVRFAEPENIAAQANSTHHETTMPTDPVPGFAKRMEELQFSPLRGPSFSHSYQPHIPGFKDISRWNLKYDGQGSLSNFLERVEEMRNSRGVSKEQLLRSAPELLIRDALLWYRTGTFHSWDDLVAQLRDAFMPYDYEFSLWDEIRRRTQGSQERVMSFVVAMENLFRKLTQMPSESTKLQLVRRNFLPYIQTRLATQTFASVQELTRIARSIEETEYRVQRFVPPPTNYRHLIEPELAYHKPNYNVNAVETTHLVSVPEVLPSDDFVSIEAVSGSTDQTSCWNCGGSGHRFNQCEQPRNRFCYRCGKSDVTSRSCPKCSKNEQKVRT